MMMPQFVIDPNQFIDPTQLQLIRSLADVNLANDLAFLDPHTVRHLQELAQDKRVACELRKHKCGQWEVAEKLLDKEILRVGIEVLRRKQFLPDSPNLPIPIGPVVIQTRKIPIPVDRYPHFNFIGRILGPKGMTNKLMEEVTGCRIMIRGRGSMRDANVERQLLQASREQHKHLHDPLHVLLQAEDTQARADARLLVAEIQIHKLLLPKEEDEDELKRVQLALFALIQEPSATTDAAHALAGPEALMSPIMGATAGGGAEIFFPQQMLSPAIAQTAPSAGVSAAAALGAATQLPPGMAASAIPQISPPAGLEMMLAGAPLFQQRVMLPPHHHQAGLATTMTSSSSAAAAVASTSSVPSLGSALLPPGVAMPPRVGENPAAVVDAAALLRNASNGQATIHQPLHLDMTSLGASSIHSVQLPAAAVTSASALPLTIGVQNSAGAAAAAAAPSMGGTFGGGARPDPRLSIASYQ